MRFRSCFVLCTIPAMLATGYAQHFHANALLDRRQQALQMLNRFTFGPRPGEVEAVMRQGPDAWFEQQLDPAGISDAALDQRLDAYPSLYVPPRDLLVQFPSNQIIRQVAEGKRPWPPDPILAAAYEVLVAKYNQRKANQAAQSAEEPSEMQKRESRLQQMASAQVIADEVLAFPKDQRMQAIVKLPVEQRITLTQFVPDPQRGLLLDSFTPREHELFYLMAGGPDGIRVIDNEFQQAKVLRAVLSQRQLLEVMTDFWYNHFNIDIRKDADQWYAPTYERDAIRAHALGKFSDLLLAAAQHPAMLWYLDNWSSIGPDSQAAEHARKKLGLNENYGREVMELHTVGVDSGYTQADVISLAKIMTGWTIDQPQQGGDFVFDQRKHEPGTIHWFGHNVSDDGFTEGQRALEWLAAQPQTAHHVCYELAQRFIADDPPPALVERMTKTWMATDGSIPDILRTMVHSPEFDSQKYYRAKVKTPLEFVASAFRATDTNPTNPSALVNEIAHMGEPLYQMQPPTGYSTTADHWMNSGALVDRLNFSLQFAGSKLNGIKFDAPRLLAAGLLEAPAAPSSLHGPSRAQSIALTAVGEDSGEDQVLSLMENMLLDGQVSEKTNAVIRKELSTPQTPSQPGTQVYTGTYTQSAVPAAPAIDPTQILNTMTALILGSPEFQMH
ncbi:MAG: DUF1800 domain-containing protein [Silvibacterium sp.]